MTNRLKFEYIHDDRERSCYGMLKDMQLHMGKQGLMGIIGTKFPTDSLVGFYHKNRQFSVKQMDWIEGIHQRVEVARAVDREYSDLGLKEDLASLFDDVYSHMRTKTKLKERSNQLRRGNLTTKWYFETAKGYLDHSSDFEGKDELSSKLEDLTSQYFSITDSVKEKNQRT